MSNSAIHILRLFFPLALLFSTGAAMSANWQIYSSASSMYTRKMDLDSVRYESLDNTIITYQIRYEASDTRYRSLPERSVIANCQSKQRFEITNENDRITWEFKNVYPGTIAEDELYMACKQIAQSPPAQQPPPQRNQKFSNKYPTPASTPSEDQETSNGVKVPPRGVASTNLTTQVNNCSHIINDEMRLACARTSVQNISNFSQVTTPVKTELIQIDKDKNSNFEEYIQRNKYIDLAQFKPNNSEKAIVIISTFNGEDVKVKVEDKVYKLVNGQQQILYLNQGKYQISFQYERLLGPDGTHPNHYIERSFIFLKNTINNIIMGRALGDVDLSISTGNMVSREHTPMLMWYRRISMDGMLINRDPLDTEPNRDFLLKDNRINSLLLFQKWVETTKNIIQEQKAIETNPNYVKQKLGNPLIDTPNGMLLALNRCNISLSGLIRKDDLPHFYKAMEYVHQQECKSILVRLASHGGDAETSMKIGLYIHLNKWNTEVGAIRGIDLPPAYQSCKSGCALVYLGGYKKKQAHENVAVHLPMDTQGRCVWEESLAVETIFRYIHYILKEKAARVFRDYSIVPCSTISLLSHELLKFVALEESKN